jgi:hypothetical protein
VMAQPMRTDPASTTDAMGAKIFIFERLITMAQLRPSLSRFVQQGNHFEHAGICGCV